MSIEKATAATESPEQMAKRLTPIDTDNNSLDLLRSRPGEGLTLQAPAVPLPELRIQIQTIPTKDQGILSKVFSYGADVAVLSGAFFLRSNPAMALGTGLMGASMLSVDLYGQSDQSIGPRAAVTYGIGLGLIGSQLLPRVAKAPL